MRRTMTVTLFDTCVDRPIPILRDVPARLEVLALALLIESITHLGEYQRVGAALHGKHLALVVVALKNPREPLV